MTLEIDDEFEEEFKKNQTAGVFIQADILLRQFRDLFANSPWAQFNPAVHALDRKRLLPEHADWLGLCQSIVRYMGHPDSCEFEHAQGLHPFRLAGIHWYQSEHVFCHPKDLPTEEQLVHLSPSELSAWRKPHAYKFRRLREQAKKHERNIPNGPNGTRMICEELLRRKNAIEESFRQIAAIRRTIARDNQVDLNVSGSIGYDLFTDQFHRRSRASFHLAMGIRRFNYFTPVIFGCDLGGAMDDPPDTLTAEEIERESWDLAENEPHPITRRGNPLRNLMVLNLDRAATVFLAQPDGSILPGQDFDSDGFEYMGINGGRGDYNMILGYHTLRQFLRPLKP